MNDLDKRVEVLERGRTRGKTLLDIGAGPLSFIATRNFNCKVTNIDISKQALREAEKEAKREKLNIEFECADATDLPYEDNTFGVVISYATLHHINVGRRKDFVCETYRVAREELVIAEYNKMGFNQVHSMDNYEAVDLDWLEKELNILGRVEKYYSKWMNIYICHKEA
jgi:ubiquinone/menaquinone biosynthesis C-methylase UbiE